MQFEIRKKRVSIWQIIIAVILICMLISAFFSANKPMDGYVDNGTEEIIDDGSTEKKLTEDFRVYSDEGNGFSFEVPSSWTELTKGGYKTFVHNQTGTTTSVIVKNYIPQINMADVSYLLEKFEDNPTDAEIISSQSINSSTKQLIYCRKINDVTYDYVSTYIWDRNNIFLVRTILKDEEYNSLKDILDYIYSSICLEGDSIIPESNGIYFNAVGNYEMEVPLNWTYGESDATVLMQDETSGMSLAVQALETTESLSNFDQLDYSQYAASGRSNYILSSFEQKDETIYAESYFTNSDTGSDMVLIQYLETTGSIEYILTCEVPKNNIDSIYKDIINTVNSFRYYEFE